MSVVLRCPHCGTSQGTSGECEACHEARVSYFCTNHTPGRWIEGSACPSCGARPGVPGREVPAPSSPKGARTAAAGSTTTSGRARAATHARRPSPSAPPAHVRRPSASPRTAPPVPGDPRDADWTSPAGASHDEHERAPGSAPLPLWQQALQAALRARYKAPRWDSAAARPRARLRLGGCLKVLLLMFAVGFLLLFLLLGTGVLLFGQSLLGLP